MILDFGYFRDTQNSVDNRTSVLSRKKIYADIPFIHLSPSYRLLRKEWTKISASFVLRPIYWSKKGLPCLLVYFELRSLFGK